MAVVFAAVLCVPLVLLESSDESSAAYYYVDDDEHGLRFTIDTSTGTAAVSKHNSIAPNDNLEIPATVTYSEQAYPVTTVASSAFLNKINLQTVVLPSSVTVIQNSAFKGCTGLTTITMNGVTEIQYEAFYGCTALETVRSANLTTIQKSAFYNDASLSSIDLGNVTTLAGGSNGTVFYHCTNLTTVDLSNVEVIGYSSFDGCSNLTSITSLANVTTIGYLAFSGCPLSSIVLPDSPISIGYRAFSNTAVTEVTLPTNISSLGHELFFNCSNLTTVHYNCASPTYSSSNQLLINGQKADLVVHIGNTVQTIPNYAFNSMKATFYFDEGSTLQSVGILGFGASNSSNKNTICSDLPSTLQSVGVSSFQNCAFSVGMPATSSVTIPAGLTTIGSSAFSNVAFTKVTVLAPTVPNGVISGNTSSLELGENVSSIPDNVLSSMYGLTSITVDPNNTHFATEGYILYGIEDSVKVSVIKAFSQDSTGITVILPDTITAIGSRAFTEKTILDLDLGSVETIGDNAFYNAKISCPIVLPATVQSCGTKVFATSGTARFTSITVSSDCLGTYMFQGQNGRADTYWNSITLNNVSTIPEGAFQYAVIKSDLEISATEIGTNAFNKAKIFGSVTLNSGLTTIGISAFEGAVFDSISVPSTVTSFGNNCFKDTVISAVTFNDTADVTIGNYAFQNTQLKSVTITKHVTSIGDYAFQNCNLLGLVVLNESDTPGTVYVPASIGTDAFDSQFCTSSMAETNPSMQILTWEGDQTDVLDSYRGTTVTNTNIAVLPDASSAPGADIAWSYDAETKTLTLGSGESDTISSWSTWNIYKNVAVKIIIGEGITEIALMDGFVACEEFTLGEDVTRFNGVTNLHNLKVLNYEAVALTSNGLTASHTKWDYDGDRSGGVTLRFNGAITSVPQYLFYGSGNTIKLKAIEFNISKDVNTTFGSNAFYKTEDVRSIVVNTFGTSGSVNVFNRTGYTYGIHLYLGDMQTPLAKAFFGNFANYLKVVEYGPTNTSIPNETFSGAYALVNVILPSSITSIGNQAFYECRDLLSISGEGVLSVGSMAFYRCDKLANINLPAAQTIGNQAFASCPSITRIDLPAATSFGTNVFRLCTNLAYVNIRSLANVSSGLFSECPNLDTVVLSNESCVIEASAFSGCTSLRNINLNGVTSIGSTAFYNCSSIVNQATDLSRVTSIGSNAFSGSNEASAPKLGVITISSLEHLYDRAFKYAGVTGDVVFVQQCQFHGEYGEIFAGCDIDSITWNSTGSVGNKVLNGIVNPIHLILKSNANASFAGSDRIASVTVAEGTTGIYQYLFQNCTGITSLTIQGDRSGENRLSIGEHAFEGCTALGPVDFTKIKAIGNFAFKGCTSLFAVADSITFTDIELHSGAFQNCTGIPTSVILSGCTVVYQDPMSLDYNTVSPFMGCTVTSLTFDGASNAKIMSVLAGVTNETYTLTVSGAHLPDCRNDTKLTHVTIGPAVADSDDILAFAGCTNLTGVDFNATNFQCGYYYTETKSPFDGLNVLVTIGSGVTNVPAYMFKGQSLSGDIVLEGIYVGVFAFQGVTGASSLTITDSQTDNFAFKECQIPTVTVNGDSTIGLGFFEDSTVQTVVIGNILYLGAEAFSGCTGLSSVTIGGLPAINGQTFYGCTSLSSVSIPANVTSIGDSAFYGCTGISSVAIPAATTSIGSSAFYGCTSLSELVIANISGFEDEQRIAIGANAFNGTVLTSVTIPARTSSLSSNSFANISTLATATINASLTAGYGAFNGSGSNGGFTITFGDSVTNVPSGLMKNSKVSSITSFGNVESIGLEAFSGCTPLAAMELPVTLETVGDNAFLGCSKLTELTIPASTTIVGESAFSGCTGLLTLTVAGDCRLGLRAFSGCTSLTTVSILGNVGFEAYVFENCNSIRDLTLPIEYGMVNTSVYGMSSVRNITFRAVSDGRGYNYGSSNTANRLWYSAILQSITFSEGVVSIGNYMFYQSTSATPITLPQSLTDIGEGAFGESSASLGTLTLSADFQTLGSGALTLCTGITSFEVSEDNPYYSSEAGILYSKAKAVLYQYPAASTATTCSISSEVSAINSFAFYGASHLTEITIPDTVAMIGNGAFEGCTGLTYVYIPSACTNISSTAFDGIAFVDSGSNAISAENLPGYTYIYKSSGPTLEQKCTVTFVTGDNLDDVDSVIVDVGVTAQAPAAPNAVDGYDFGGWFANESCTIPWDFGSDTILANTFIYAKAAPEEYTITIHNRTGPDSQSSEIYTVHFRDTAIDIQIPNVEHKHMIGIYYQGINPNDPLLPILLQIAGEDLNFVYSDSVSDYLDTDSRWIYRGNVDLYVEWDDIHVSVEYHGNNTGNAYDYDTVRWNDQYTYRTASFLTADTGYELECWNTQADGQGTSYVAGDEFEFPQNAEYGDIITLYAKWRLIQYSVTYEMNGGGSNDGRNPDQYTYETATFVLYNAVRNGYDFGGWYLNPNLEDGMITTVPQHSTGDITVYAKWTIIDYSITYVLNGGVNGQNPETFNVTTGDIYFAAATRDYYDFRGWYTDPQFDPYSEREVIFAGSMGDVTVYAKWRPTEYTVTYNLDYGTHSNPTSYNYESSLIELQDATWPYATFAGWYDNAGFTGDAVETIPAQSHGNKELFAKWDMTQYSITYNLDGGTNGSNPATYTYTTATINLADATKIGHTFRGWYNNEEFLGDEITQIVTHSSGNKTLYAKFTANRYTISFDSVGGSEVDDIIQSYGSQVSAPPAPTRTGYTFQKWQLNGVDYEFSTMPAQNIELTAVWAVSEYNITYNLDDGVNALANPATYTYFTATINLADATKTGYSFGGWFTNSEFTGDEVTQIALNSTGDKVLYAKFTVNQYTISFDSNGGSAVTAITQDYGTAIQAPADPTKEGYTFNGWLKGGQAYQIPATMPAENIDLVASWTINQYTISFNSNGGSSVPAITQNYGTQVNAPQAPTFAGYTFSKWQLNGVDYEFATMPAQNIALDAVWNINQYTISFDSNGGSAVTAITQDYGSAVIAPQAPTLTGYTFSKWQLNGVDYEFTTMPAQNITLDAVWNINQYTMSFNSNGGSSVPAITQNYGTAIQAPADPTKEGYTFNGWLKGGQAYQIPATIPAENIDLVASWTINQYTISFNSNGGSAVTAITQDYGSAVVAPPAPTLTGHSFSKWQLNGVDYEFTTMPAQNITLTATWTVNPYTISFDTHGGSAVTAITQNYGTEVSAPASPTKDYYTFSKWQLNGVDYEFTTMPAENITLDAVWTPLQYDVTYHLNGGTNGNNPASYNIESDSIVFADATRDYYNFSGWYADSYCTGDRVTGIPKGSHGNVDVYAKWTPVEYVITFHLNNGTNHESNAGTYTVVSETVILLAPTRVGYTFGGWFSNADFEGNVVMEIVQGSHGDVELYAKWTADRYPITYYLDGATNPQSNPAYYTVEGVASLAGATKEGYTFGGWFDNEQFTGDALTSIAPGRTGALSLYAKLTIKTVTISFDSNHGSAVQAITAEYGSAVSAPESPVREGYTFVNWKYNGDAYVFSTMPGDDITLTAEWSINSYTIQFDSVGGSVVNSMTLEYGATINAPSSSKDGYQFAGWTPELPATMPARNLSVKATWTANTYTVTYDVNGGNPLTPNTLTVTFGAEYSLAIPTTSEADKYFDGWYRSDDLIATSGNWAIARDVELTAHWSDTQFFEVKFVGGEGTEGQEPQVERYELFANVPMPAQCFERTGYNFIGWLAPNGHIYTINQSYSYVDQDLQFVAQWEPAVYQIHYVLDGVELRDGAYFLIQGTYGQQTNVMPTYQKTGYDVTPWASQTVAVTDGQFTMPAGEVTFNATSAPHTYTITLQCEGGSPGSATVVYGGGLSGYTAVSKRGYDVSGYYTDSNVMVIDGNGQLVSNVYGIVDINGHWKMAADLTLSARFTAHQHNLVITYQFVNGSQANPQFSQAFDYGAQYSHDSPALTGYVADKLTVSGVMDDEDVNVTVTYAAEKFTIFFNSNGGTEVTSITQDYGSNVAAPTAPTRDGFSFREWLYNGEAYTFTTMPAQNITLTAEWSKLPVSPSEEVIEFSVEAESVLIDKSVAEVTEALNNEAKTEVEVKGDVWTMEIPKDVITEATGSVSAGAKALSNSDLVALPEEVKKIVEGKTVFSLSLTDDNGSVSFAGKNIKVTLPYELKAGESASDVKVFFISNENKAVQVDATYDSVNECAVFSTDHFSTWFIDASPAPSSSDGGMDMMLIVGIVIAIAAVAGVAAYFLVIKKKA